MTKNISTVTPKVLYDLRKNGHPIELIDVRTPAEYRECHATQARNVPFDSLDPKMVPLKLPSKLFVNQEPVRKRHVRSFILWVTLK